MLCAAPMTTKKPVHGPSPLGAFPAQLEVTHTSLWTYLRTALQDQQHLPANTATGDNPPGDATMLCLAVVRVFNNSVVAGSAADALRTCSNVTMCDSDRLASAPGATSPSIYATSSKYGSIACMIGSFSHAAARPLEANFRRFPRRGTVLAIPATSTNKWEYPCSAAYAATAACETMCKGGCSAARRVGAEAPEKSPDCSSSSLHEGLRGTVALHKQLNVLA